MKLTLTSIREFVQEVVHAIASVIGVEVMVFDASRNIVAGTGETYVEVGNQYNEGSMTGRLLATGRPLIARRSGQCPECAPAPVTVAAPITPWWLTRSKSKVKSWAVFASWPSTKISAKGTGKRRKINALSRTHVPFDWCRPERAQRP